MSYKLKIIFTILFIISIVFSACHQEKDEETIKQETIEFADYYFNWQFEKAKKYCELSSKQWLNFAASQVTQDDVDLLNSMEQNANIEIIDISHENEDTVAYATVQVNNFAMMDTIGKPAQIKPQEIFKLRLVYTQKRWKISLLGLPKPLKK